ncbi:pyridine nucleotide-disulfide oxidoreductase, partial [Ostertagia ostertagi]
NVFYLRVASEANSISTNSKGKHVVCIGGSFIGMEIASALVLTAASVTVVCLTEEPLPALGIDIGAAVRKKFEAKGVKILVNASAKSFQGSDHVSGVVLKSGETLDADVVVVGI